MSKVLKGGAQTLLRPATLFATGEHGGTQDAPAPDGSAAAAPRAAAATLDRPEVAPAPPVASPSTPAGADPESETLLTAARAEAEAIRAEALAEAEALHQSAWNEAHAAGLAAGRAEAEAELKGAMLEVEGMRRKVEAQRDSLLASAQNELLALAVTLARRIVVAELSLRPEIIVDMVAEALQQLRAGADPRVFAHPDDVERLADPTPGPRRQQVAGNVELVPDSSLEPGEFVIKSRQGQVEGRRKREFAELVAFLQEVGEARPWP